MCFLFWLPWVKISLNSINLMNFWKKLRNFIDFPPPRKSLDPLTSNNTYIGPESVEDKRGTIGRSNNQHAKRCSTRNKAGVKQDCDDNTLADEKTSEPPNSIGRKVSSEKFTWSFMKVSHESEVSIQNESAQHFMLFLFNFHRKWERLQQKDDFLSTFNTKQSWWNFITQKCMKSHEISSAEIWNLIENGDEISWIFHEEISRWRRNRNIQYNSVWGYFDTK